MKKFINTSLILFLANFSYGEINLTPSWDSYIYTMNGGIFGHTRGNLYALDGEGSSHDMSSIIVFDFSSLDSSQAPSSATLNLYNQFYGGYGGGLSNGILPGDVNFFEQTSTVTPPSTYPGPSGAQISNFTNPNAANAANYIETRYLDESTVDTWISIDITELARGWVLNPSSHYGILITPWKTSYNDESFSEGVYAAFTSMDTYDTETLQNSQDYIPKITLNYDEIEIPSLHLSSAFEFNHTSVNSGDITYEWSDNLTDWHSVNLNTSDINLSFSETHIDGQTSVVVSIVNGSTPNNLFYRVNVN